MAKSRLSKDGPGKKGGPSKDQPGGKPQKDDPAAASSDDSDFEEEEGGERIAGVYVPPPPIHSVEGSNEGTTSRLIITHIVNLNFKSYAGRRVLGPFHKSFTCIIGPNGSGKSNVIDSMLFVFGYRATKIRSKKISVLLHKSENHRDIRSATVEVHFVKIIDKEGEGFEIVPNSAFYVSRTAFYDNSSHYTINGKRCQFKEVAGLLGSHGIDLKHNRFLILQGEVEQIAMMKPKGPNEHESGMLEYLEDIVGTTRYKKPIQKLEHKVEVLTNERQEKLNRVQLAGKEKDALKGPMEEAKQFLIAKNEVTRTMNKLLQIDIQEHSSTLKQLEEEKEKLEKDVKEKKSKLKEAQEKVAEKEKATASQRKEFEDLKGKKEKLSDAFNKTEHRATQLREIITQTNKKRKKAMEQKAQEEKKLADLEKIPEKNEKEIGELKVLQENLQKEKIKEEKEVEKVLESLKSETQGLQEEKDGINNVLIGLNEKRETARSKYEIAKSELSAFLSKEQKEKEKLQKLKDSLQKVSSSLEEKQKALQEIEQNIPEMEQSLEGKQQELNRLKNEEIHVSQELNQQRALLEEKRHSKSAFDSRNRVVNFLMKCKERGEIPGIIGRLGDLGGIPEKYDCAVSTACGPLDFIVVDNSSTAKECILALKRHNVGKGTFLALDKQSKFIPNCQKQFKGPENTHRLVDLINLKDPRMKPAFYYGLRDTLVANDLGQAKRVAYGATRYRVVTLNGEIIEMAGTMSGGGNQKLTGRMGRSATVDTDTNSDDDIRRLGEIVGQLQERANSLRQRINQLEPEIFQLDRTLKKNQIDLASTQMAVQNFAQQVPSLESQVENQEAVVARTISDPRIVKEKTKTVESLKAEFDAAAAESGELEKQVAEISSKITAITGGRMQAAQQKLNKVLKQLQKIASDIPKLTVAIKTSQRNCKLSKDKIKALESEISEAEDSLRTGREENEALEEEAKKVTGFIEEIAAKIVELETVLKGDKSETNQLNKEINDIKTSLLNVKEEMDKVGKSIAETNYAVKSTKDKLAALKLEVIPDEEDADYSLPTYSKEELQQFDKLKLTYSDVVVRENLSNQKPNLKAIEDYREKVQILKEKVADYEDCQRRRAEARKGLDHVRKCRLTEFMAGFNIISSKLKEMYQMITFGGDAELELLDTLDPFSEGVGFSVRPPKKSWKNISNLSGGEKTLSSLALVFALHYYKPSPLYFMDEIDAALDFKNVSIVGHYIKERTKNAQFIIISLRSNMFELADVLVGIYKTDNCTKSLTITPMVYADAEMVINNFRNGYSIHADRIQEEDFNRSPPRKRQR